MAVAASHGLRVTVDGKFFRLGANKFFVKGVAYGPFSPEQGTQSFPSETQTASDFAQIRALGANLIRVYEVPPRWFLDLAASYDLKVLVDVPWNKHLCFLDSAENQRAALAAVRGAVFGCASHPSVFAFSVANEIPSDIVRWSGAAAVSKFIDQLVAEAKKVDPATLCTFTNYPTTEFLRPQSPDFVCFNVYLHAEPAFRNYLARLQMTAEAKPLLLGEIGVDSIREGEANKCRMLRWQIADTFQGGAAGAVVFSYTDDWWRGGFQVEDWAMGLTSRQREPKDSYYAVKETFATAPHFPLPRYPKVSVVVASYNGARTLRPCLESLQRLNYPDYEVVPVDDGSTDDTATIAAAFPKVRYSKHPQNLGLSVARNTGITAAQGEIVAFTDADCRADEDWLLYLVGDLLSSDFAGIGGPNLLPPEDSLVAAAVMASPGGPVHVMLTDRQAEHIPGCNMAFYKWALQELGGFDPIFRLAGDDVDICWRLQQAGYRLGFSPSAFVWHYRRSAVDDYLRQQRGYGEAEALLVRKHPEYFNSFGGSMWRGRIYGTSRLGLLVRPPIIYRGTFGSGAYQLLYTPEPAGGLMLCTTLEYHVLATIPLWVLAIVTRHVFPLALTSLLLSLGICAVAGAQADLPPARTRWWSRPLVALLFFLQPIVRGWARYQGRLTLWPLKGRERASLDSVARRDSSEDLSELQYWSEQPLNRLAWLADISHRLDEQQWPNRTDVGWSDYDVEIHDTKWTRLQLVTAVEDHGSRKQLVRCRLKPHWSLRAKLAFGLVAAAQLVVLALFLQRSPWLWLTCVALPAFAWFLHRQARTLQSVFAVFLDQVAVDWNLLRVRASAQPAKTRPGGLH